MADWATLQAQLPDALAALMGIPCQWQDQPRAYVVGPVASLDVIAEATLGVDDVQWKDVPGGAGPGDDQIQAEVIGQRLFTLSVRVWSPSQRLDESARRYLEQLRTRLAFPSSRDTLLGLGLSVVGTEAVVSLDPMEDGRVASEAVLDVRLAHVVRDADAPIPFIENTLTESEYLRDPTGAPTPLQSVVDTREI